MKTLFVHFRKSIKLVIIIVIALFLVLGVLYFLFKPMYAVKLNGTIIGYTDTKRQLEERIDKYMNSGDGDQEAFLEIDQMPEYEICYSKKDVEINEDKVFDTVIASGTPYYKNFAIMQDGEEKAYVNTAEDAEKIIAELKEKNSTNIESISYVAKYSSEKLEKSTPENVVANLYVAPKEVVHPQTSPAVTTSSRKTSYGTVNTSQKVSYDRQVVGVSFARPVSGTITSRFGRRSRGTHTGLDIATSKGTPIGAAAAGTVTYAGPKGTYGNLVVIDHGNGVQTYYAHCSSISCHAGQTVSQGQTISTVGSTGNSTGPHLHLEIRINGICQNPQNYLY